MKNLFCVLVIATLALLGGPPKTLAQDAASRPIEIPSPTTSPTPATPASTPTPALQTPATTVAPGVDSSPEPTQASPAEKTKPKKRAARGKKERVAPSDETTTSEEKPKSRAETLRSGRSAESQLKALEQEWEANFTDTATVDRILADDFVGTSPAGKLMNKQALLREAREGGPAAKTTPHDLEVHFYDNGVAVVTGRTRQVYHGSAGRAFQREYRFTDTWVQRGGQWRCVASQSTLLPSQ